MKRQPRLPVAAATDPTLWQQYLDRKADWDAYVLDLFHPIYEFSFELKPGWLVEDLLPESCLTVLTSDPKVGKTRFATALAMAVATGTPFLGRPTKQTGVLWLSMEESFHERTAAVRPFRHLFPEPEMIDPLTAPAYPIPYYTAFEHIPIDTDDGIAALISHASLKGVGLIVVDPLHASTSGRSLTDGWAARNTLQRLKRLCDQQKICALVLHHVRETGKLQERKRRIAESAQIAATASMAMIMTRTERKAQGDSVIELNCRGRGLISQQTLYIRSEGVHHYEPMDKPELEPTAPIDKHTETKQTVESAVLATLKGRELTPKEIVALVPYAESTVRNAITRLRLTNKIQEGKGWAKRGLYFVVEKSEKSENPVIQVQNDPDSAAPTEAQM